LQDWWRSDPAKLAQLSGKRKIVYSDLAPIQHPIANTPGSGSEDEVMLSGVVKNVPES